MTTESMVIRLKVAPGAWPAHDGGEMRESAVDVEPCVAVIGAGLIGRSWAIVFAGGGCDVALYDSSAGVAESARALVAEGLFALAEHGLIADAKAAHARVRV